MQFAVRMAMLLAMATPLQSCLRRRSSAAIDLRQPVKGRPKRH